MLTLVDSNNNPVNVGDTVYIQGTLRSVSMSSGGNKLIITIPGAVDIEIPESQLYTQQALATAQTAKTAATPI